MINPKTKLVAVALVTMSTLATAWAQQPSAGKSIAILPVINATGEKWLELKEKLTERVSNQLFKAFADRAFSIAPTSDVQSALESSKIDLSDEEYHRREPLYSLGEALNVDYVVFFVITHNTQRTRHNVFVTTPEGEVTVKYWLLDCRKREPIASAKSETAKARPHSFLGVAKGSDQQLTAADRVVPAALKDFLKLFPTVKPDK